MLNAILQKFGYEIRNVGMLANPSAELTRLLTGGSSTAAGVSVNAETALRSPTTLACVRVLSESIGSLPVHTFRRGEGGGRERERAHPVAELLSGDWAPWAGGVETRTALQFDALLHGVGYGQVIRAGARPVEIHRLEPLAVTEDIDPASGEPSYRIRQANGGERRLAWGDVLALRTPGSAPGRKLCLIDLCREAIAVDLLMAKDQGRLFRNSARPGGAVTVEKKLSDAAFARLKASLEGDYSGENAGKTMLLEEGSTWQSTSTFSAEQMQFLELRQFAIREIGRAFKVPGPLIGDLERATWRNVEELNRQFLTLHFAALAR